MGDVKVDDDAILKSFLAEVGEVERDNEVVRFLSIILFLIQAVYKRLSFNSWCLSVSKIYSTIDFPEIFVWFIFTMHFDYKPDLVKI